MGQPKFKERMRQQLLARRGLTRVGQGHLESLPPLELVPEFPGAEHKTLAMRLIEQRFGVPIEELLVEGALQEVGTLLGIDQSTVSKWRKLLGLRD